MCVKRHGFEPGACLKHHLQEGWWFSDGRSSVVRALTAQTSGP